MDYYIQGDAAKADQIRAAFEKLGYNTGNLGFTSSKLYYTIEGKVELMCTKALQKLIKTHPDYKELELPVQPKLKVGNWIVGNDGVFKITQYEDEHGYNLTDTAGGVVHFVSPDYVQSNFRLWAIENAKDGDVITNGKLIVIFNKLEEPTYKQHIIAYVGLDLCGRLQITEDTWQLGVDKAMPATKEQRGLLFKRIKENGYTWDVDKKELRKIKEHYDTKNFHAGMPVLVRADNNCRWDYSVFSRITGNEDWQFAVCNGVSVAQCIPFNEKTKHLLGTTDMCPEEYINW